MATKPKPAILPSDLRDPTGVDRLERGAMREFARRIKRVRKAYVDALNTIPVEPAVNKRYAFRLDQALLRSLLANLDLEVDAIIIGADPSGQTWLFESFVGVAYQRGTAQEFANLAQQSPAYSAGRVDLSSLIRSEPYQRRIALIRARVFEEMKGLSASVKADMGRVLTDGIGRGLNPRDIARNLAEQEGIDARRANRVARTEVTTALRRARWDEADDAEEQYGLEAKELHLSALSPTTRRTHAARHGRLFTRDEVRDWWSQDGNSINCFLPGTKVRGRFVAGSKAKYRGPVIKIVTAGGRSLTVTPNHPILTSKGMIPAAEVGKGDYAVTDGIQVENLAGVGALDDQQVERVIEDVFGSLMECGHSFSAGVHAIDFHGDAALMDKNVQVVRAERELVVGFEPALGKRLDDLALIHANPNVAHVLRPMGADISRLNLAAARLMRKCRSKLTKLRAKLLGAKGRSIGVAAPFQSEAFESSGELDSRNAGFFAQHLDAFPRDMLGVKFREIEPVRKTGALDSALLEKPIDGACAHTSARTNHRGAVASQEFLDRVIWVGKFDFSGHVFDLEERSGLMVANGIITSNCKCSTASVMVDDDGKPLVPSIIERARKAKENMEKRGYAWSDTE